MFTELCLDKMVLEYNYWYFTSAIPPAICDQIIEMGLTQLYESETKYGKKSTEATTGGWKHKTERKTIPTQTSSIQELKENCVELDNIYVRDSNVAWLNDINIYEILWPFVREANKNAQWNFEWDFTEDLQFTKYTKGQFYGWHTDAASKPYKEFNPDTDKIVTDEYDDPIYENGELIPIDQEATTTKSLIGKIRKLSSTLTLNDGSEYDGGDLRFDLGPHVEERYITLSEIRPKGSIVIFPSHIFHQVTPITKGTRYSLVSWHTGNPWK